ncbi:hypothetical protein OOZ63_04200 [Paucibacter sp. PLA-PC-4]|uniref:hypothetical protein n=1 Tax=Paucibacter sp. PLA-PC-4 TaxID=2993655 RepID=UPI002248771B|nr:hypothetical protein [Paucibacter sp. PLA-PC-4]MCX2861036.1 hypothetical protein [Paucibacter sp. PLA-PC-4]
MRIDTAPAYAPAAQRTATRSRAQEPPSSAAAEPISPGAGSPQSNQADFSHMSRAELFDWMNAQIKSGEMSLSDSSGFLGMTLRMPVSGAAATLDDQERVDFMQLAQDGISWAEQHNEKAQQRMLQRALAMMQQHQGQGIRVDVLA